MVGIEEEQWSLIIKEEEGILIFHWPDTRGNIVYTRRMSALRAKYCFIVVNYYFLDDIVN